MGSEIFFLLKCIYLFPDLKKKIWIHSVGPCEPRAFSGFRKVPQEAKRTTLVILKKGQFKVVTFVLFSFYI